MGGLLCLSMLAFALFCWVQKRKKKTEETDIIHIDEHKKIKETIVPGPFGTQTVVISVEDDVHIDEEIKKKTEEGGHHHHGLHVEPSSSSTDQGTSRSADDEVGISKLLHHHQQKHDNDNA
ncbi:hypothetical protein Ahy_A06g030091 isoform C [Arachis hypogaea]|nr:hypothetical protein Ahy_A06g030091 isoform C [Arachis hypogaea]